MMAVDFYSELRRTADVAASYLTAINETNETEAFATTVLGTIHSL